MQKSHEKLCYQEISHYICKENYTLNAYRRSTHWHNIIINLNTKFIYESKTHSFRGIGCTARNRRS